MAMIMVTVYRLTLYYVESTTDLDFKLWDVKTCTPADYTVQIKITEEMYEGFRQSKQNNPNSMNLRDYIK